MIEFEGRFRSQGIYKKGLDRLGLFGGPHLFSFFVDRTIPAIKDYTGNALFETSIDFVKHRGDNFFSSGVDETEFFFEPHSRKPLAKYVYEIVFQGQYFLVVGIDESPCAI